MSRHIFDKENKHGGGGGRVDTMVIWLRTSQPTVIRKNGEQRAVVEFLFFFKL